MTGVLVHFMRLCALLTMLCASARAANFAVFGDSISDGGQGTNGAVKAFFATTVDYPPAPMYFKGHWSNGKTWPEYFGATNAVTVINEAIGSSTVLPISNSVASVGDFFPDNLISNKKGLTQVPLKDLGAQIAGYLSTNTPTAADVFVIESGSNDLLGDALADVTKTLQFIQGALVGTFPAIVPEVVAGIQAQLQVLYNAGARRFIVFGIPAIEQLPVINVANRIVNLIDSGKSLPQDGVLTYAKKLSVDVDSQIQAAAKAFQMANPLAAVTFFGFADAQRSYKLNGGFIDTVNGCRQGKVATQYATSDKEDLGTLVLTNPGAVATLSLNPDVNFFAIAGSIFANPAPTTLASGLTRLIDVLTTIATGGTSSNKLNHILGTILSSLPLGQGGLNPYDFVPSCINDAANHMYHDELHPTTKQHELIAKSVTACFNALTAATFQSC